jgi:ribose transport system permease protein
MAMSGAHIDASGAESAPNPDVAEINNSQRQRSRPIAAQTERFALPIFLVVLLVVFSVWLPTFRTVGNVQSMVYSQAVTLMLAIVAMSSLRAGLPDFSIASVMTLSTVLVARYGPDTSLPVLILIILVICGLIGAAQAVLVVLLEIDVFVISLGTLTALAGVAAAISKSEILITVPSALTDFSRADFLGLPLMTWAGWLFVVLAWYICEWTPLGRYLLFVGGNAGASRLAGLPVKRLRFGVLVSNAMLAGAIGILLAGQLGAADPSIGGEYLLGPFAAAFLGATAIRPGRFNAFGTFFAAYLLVVGITGLQLLGASSWATDTFNGCVLVLAVTLARLGRRRQ